ncbi:MAG TPA: glycosyltransferase family 39 protein [Polyangia bacterium]
MDILVPIFAFVPVGIVVIIVVLRSAPPAERQWLLPVLVTAFLMRIGVATMFVAFPGLRIFHEDTEGTEWGGMMIASAWRGEGPPMVLPEKNWGFYHLAGIIYYVFGRYQVNVSYFNALLGTLITYCVYNLSKQLFHVVVAKRAALLVGFMPSMVLWGSMALKDVPVTFFIILSLSSCVALKDKITTPALAGTLLPLIPIQAMRFYIVYFVVFAIVIGLFLDRGMSRLTGIYRQLALFAAIGGLFLMIGLADQAETDASSFMSLEYVSSYRRGMAISANSGFDADVDISRPSGALAYLPIGLAHLLLAPFPWQMTSLRAMIAAPETIFWWTLFPATIRGMIFAVRRRLSETLPLLVFSGTLSAVYSLMHGNVGSAFRQRAQILVFLFIFSSVGTFLKKARQVGVDEGELLHKKPAPAT